MKINSEQIINLAKMRLGLQDTTAADATLEKWINMGAQHIDSRQTYIIAQQDIPIECHQAELPSNAIEVIAYKFNTQGCSGCCAGNPNVTPGTFDVNMACPCSCPVWYVADRMVLTQWNGYGANLGYACNYFDVQNGIIKFPSTVTATEITVYYRGYNTDCEGLMVFDEIQERGLSAFAAYSYACSGQNIKSFQPFQLAEWKKEWTNQKAWLRGTYNVQDTRLHKTTVAAIGRALLVNPLITLDRNY